MSRYRTRTLDAIATSDRGTVHYYDANNQWITGYYDDKVVGAATHYESMTDELESDGPPFTEIHELLANRYKIFPLGLNGTSSNTVYHHAVLSNYGTKNHDSILDAGLGHEPTSPSLAELGLKAIANMNPNRPEVDLPVFLFEFKDLPRMLKGAGDVLSGKAKPSDAAGGYVAYSFGWAPLVSDLRKLMDIAAMVEKKANYIRDLSGPNGRKLRRSLGGNTTDWILGNYSMPAVTGPFVWRSRYSVTWKAWYTARAQLKTPLPETLGNRSLNEAALRAATGTSGLSPAQVWAATPWTWAIDYLASIGDYLEATRGGIPWEFSSLSVMKETRWKTRVEGVSNPQGLSVTGGFGYRVKKERSHAVMPLLPFFRSGFLSAHQTGILASLTTAKAFKSVGL